MRRGALFTIAIFVAFMFSLNLVSSANSCISQDQIILRLSADTNAHGELFNGAGSYTTEICYNDIFGVNGNGNRVCSGANGVLRLSASTNAHAEGPSGSYSMQICYGDLNCRLDSPSNCNGANEEIVVRLSSNTNAHLEIASGTNYNNVICCSTIAGPPPPSQPDAYWANVNRNELANGFDINLDTSVKLIAAGVSANNNVNYDIYDTDCLGYALDTTCSDLIRSGLTIKSDANGIAIFDYIFTLADFAGDDNNEDQLELFFIAKSVQQYEQKSGMINLKKQIIDEPVVQKNGCAQFDEQNECENAPESAWRADEADIEKVSGLVGGAGCGNTRNNGDEIRCDCNWNANIDICEFRWTAIPAPLPPGVTQECVGGCNIQTEYGECTDNSATITYLTSFEPEVSCTSTEFTNTADENDCDGLDGETTSALCGFAPSLILPFFGFWQFMISILGIAIIYALLSFRRRA